MKTRLRLRPLSRERISPSFWPIITTPGADEKVIELAGRFLRDHPGSAHADDVRMKLGQVHFRNNHYPNAETEFTLLAQRNPSGPYAEAALFLAGRAAMRTLNSGAVGRALGLFEQVAQRGGPLKLYARQQQASIQHSLGKENETIIIYENILSATPPPEPVLAFCLLLRESGQPHGFGPR